MNAWRCTAALLILLCQASGARGEILVRWEHEHVPAPQNLGLTALAIPAGSPAALRRALEHGYRVFLEIETEALDGLELPAGSLGGVILRGHAPPEQLRLLQARLERLHARVFVVDDGGKWPHIRSNMVTSHGDVLQVTGRSAQPWLENNVALLRILRAGEAGIPALLTYDWVPRTGSGADVPQIGDYLAAIAEAGSFGGHLLLPLHEGFQQELASGEPQARAGWDEIRRHLQFYGWDQPVRYRPLANVAVVTSNPRPWHAVMNLLARHNVPFEPVSPSGIASGGLNGFDLAIVLDLGAPDAAGALAAWARGGGTVVVAGGRPLEGEAFPWRAAGPSETTDERLTYEIGRGRAVELVNGAGDPDAFALAVRRILGRDRRVLDVWNGLTAIAMPFHAPYSSAVLITMMNYAREPLPLQLRIRGTFRTARFESPEQPAILLPCLDRGGFTEIVVPELRAGARLFLSR